jgi:radical SAM protein with 4Fe4S-binding SPASM domain
MMHASPLPADATLLPISSGELLVSRSHALFCPVPAGQVHALTRVLDRQAADLSSLSGELVADLERHGFFGPPRPTEPDPPSVQLQLTNDCNLGCAYCCTNSGQPRTDELSFEQWSRVVRQIEEAKGTDGQVALLGGEPFLMPWAIDLAELIVDLGHNLTIFTNGIRHGRDEELARRTARLAQRGAEVRVSLAGVTAELCDAVSGAQRFNPVLQGIHQLARFGGQALVDLMVLPQHVEQTALHLHQLRGQLPEQTKITLGLLYLSGREQGEHFFATRSELESALDRIAFEAGEVIAATRTSPTTYRREGCGCALGHHLHVRSDGALFPCFKMEERVGDLATDDFVEAARRTRNNPHPASSLPTCTDCALATLCGGGCRSDNLLYTGDADLPVCGDWRVRVICELLAEDQVTVVDWPAHHLLAEAHHRGIEAPERLVPHGRSRHLIDT